MEIIITWLRYGIMGRPMIRVMNGKPGILSWIFLIVLLSFLFLMIMLMIYKVYYGLFMVAAFVLCFGYKIGLGMAIVGGIIGILVWWIQRIPFHSPEYYDSKIKHIDQNEQKLTNTEVDEELYDLDMRAYQALESTQEYDTYIMERALISTRQEINDFRNQWETRIYENLQQKD